LQQAPPIQPVPPPARQLEVRPISRYAVQVAAFSDYERARRTQRTLQREGAATHLGLVEEAGMRYYRLRLGPFVRQEDAAETAARINALGFPALIVADRW
jgi:cell division protein FtsN